MALTRLKPTSVSSTGTFSFANANVVTNSNLGNLATANYFTGTLTTSAQPNITSVGTLTSVTVTGLAHSGNVRTTNILDTSGTMTIQTKYSGLSGDIGIVGNVSVGTGGSGNVSASYFLGNGSQLTGISTAATVTTNAQPNITSVGTLTGVTVTGATTLNGTTTLNETTEVVATPSGTTYDYSTGSVFYVNQPGANFTPNITNLPTTDNRVSIITLMINQSTTPGLPTAIQIGGVGQTIKWLGGAAPSGVGSSLQVVSFALLRYGAAWIVSAQGGAFI